MSDLTSEDEGKRVVDASDRPLGRVESVDGETLYVDLEDGIEVNWGETDDGTYALGADAIDSIEDEEIHLRGEH
ncbi:hypothetical protein BRC86_11070 [Halobacteriales archaeon QS_3_64_16]|nr:MAG: hypothetical protein BRC86_11070 [Halobacteriales archaeon QS_3_64_16]